MYAPNIPFEAIPSGRPSLGLCYILFLLTCGTPLFGLSTTDRTISSATAEKSAAREANQVPHIQRKAEERAAVGAALPNVLLLGDSISISYTQQVQAGLSSKATVSRAMTPDGQKADNCQDTVKGLAEMDRWLMGRNWQVIHFNWGLWDLCYRRPDSSKYGASDKYEGKQAVPLGEYAHNLEAIVLRLKATGAQLIWASITVVPEGEPGRYAGDEVKYNEVAAGIMKKHGVFINDLHSFTTKMSPDKFRAPADVHYTKEGANEIAVKVIEAIERALTAKP